MQSNRRELRNQTYIHDIAESRTLKLAKVEKSWKPSKHAEICASSNRRRVTPRIKGVSIIRSEFGETDGFASENLLDFLSHCGGFAFAVVPLEVEKGIRVPLRDTCRQQSLF